jgi:hypothetical protein
MSTGWTCGRLRRSVDPTLFEQAREKLKEAPRGKLGTGQQLPGDLRSGTDRDGELLYNLQPDTACGAVCPRAVKGIFQDIHGGRLCLKSEMEDEEVLAKARAATAWCRQATEHELESAGKPWRYLLSPDDAITVNCTVEGLIRQFERT